MCPGRNSMWRNLLAVPPLHRRNVNTSYGRCMIQGLLIIITTTTTTKITIITITTTIIIIIIIIIILFVLFGEARKWHNITCTYWDRGFLYCMLGDAFCYLVPEIIFHKSLLDWDSKAQGIWELKAQRCWWGLLWRNRNTGQRSEVRGTPHSTLQCGD